MSASPSSMVVKHGPCLLTLKKKKKGIQAFETRCMRKLLRLSYLEHKNNDWVRNKISFPVGPQEHLLATVKEVKSCMVRTCHAQRQPLQNHTSGHLGGCTTPWSADDMLDGQHQRTDISAHARTVRKGLQQKGLEEDLC